MTTSLRGDYVDDLPYRADLHPKSAQSAEAADLGGCDPTSGSNATGWTQGFQYDGFGNLTAKVTNGVTAGTPIAVDAAGVPTNRLQNAGYDLNGNMTSGAGVTMGYDEANRLASASAVSGGTEYYVYTPANNLLAQTSADGQNVSWNLWGAHGEKLGTFGVLCAPYSGGCPYVVQVTPNLKFAGAGAFRRRPAGIFICRGL